MKTKLCIKSGCSRTALPGTSYCEKHKALNVPREQRKVFTYRVKSASWADIYRTYQWRKARAEFLKDNPCCVMCGAPATVVDHIIHHQGNMDLFWDRNNWQPLCQTCHSRKTFKENHGFHKSP